MATSEGTTSASDSGIVAGQGSVGRFARLRSRLSRLPLKINILLVIGVAGFGWVWSFEELTHFADATGFGLPWIFPLVVDGLVAALGVTVTNASLDNRPAILARVFIGVASALSVALNVIAATKRIDDPVIWLVAGVPPAAAFLAFEFVMAEVRRQEERRRGVPARTHVPRPRGVRLALAPIRTVKEWRQLVLVLTDAKREAAVTAGEPVLSPVEELRLQGEERARRRAAGVADGRRLSRREAVLYLADIQDEMREVQDDRARQLAQVEADREALMAEMAAMETALAKQTELQTTANGAVSEIEELRRQVAARDEHISVLRDEMTGERQDYLVELGNLQTRLSRSRSVVESPEPPDPPRGPAGGQPTNGHAMPSRAAEHLGVSASVSAAARSDVETHAGYDSAGSGDPTSDVSRVVEWLIAGEELTGGVVATRLSVHPKKGQRMLRQAKEIREADPHRGLKVVGRRE